MDLDDRVVDALDRCSASPTDFLVRQFGNESGMVVLTDKTRDEHWLLPAKVWTPPDPLEAMLRAAMEAPDEPTSVHYGGDVI